MYLYLLRRDFLGICLRAANELAGHLMLIRKLVPVHPLVFELGLDQLT